MRDPTERLRDMLDAIVRIERRHWRAGNEAGVGGSRAAGRGRKAG